MKPFVLIIMDGWGVRQSKKSNAVKLAKTPVFDKLWKENSHCVLKAAEEAVGLPKGYMGNSEVGHFNLGAGRLVKQEVTKINESIKNGSFFKNKVLISTIKKIKKDGGRLHLMGLLSDAGVHSHINHLFALMKLARRFKVDVLIHIFSDGRDTPPKSVLKYIKQLKKKIKTETIATISGRYYAMDRDNRWNRTKRAYETIIGKKGLKAKSVEEAVQRSYSKGEGDEFILPTIISDYDGVKTGDGFIFSNFREDRARQLTMALGKNKFGKFGKTCFACMYEYDSKLGLPVAFGKPHLKNVLAEVLSKAGKKQFHTAETEKYAHVTYFFNGGKEKQFKGESRKIVPSPHVATYDKKPEMSAAKVCDGVLKQMSRNDFVVVNFANPDMVGHTGILKTTVKAVEVVDKCVGKIVKKALSLDGMCLITADHGNCEEMVGKWATSHTLNQVPCVLVGRKVKLKNGKLSNVAPTVLKLMGLKKPKEMGGALF
ncbi:2,3-bisphosphoglycerate-independent phosphoglycerate mutase [Nanoarchaeota archaeon]